MVITCYRHVLKPQLQPPSSESLPPAITPSPATHFFSIDHLDLVQPCAGHPPPQKNEGLNSIKNSVFLCKIVHYYSNGSILYKKNFHISILWTHFST